jgi:signal transduction histidine kinase
MGLAWTAHELRTPLLAAKAAMERLLMRVEEGAVSVASASDRDLLRWSREELEQLAGQLEGFLRWGAGDERLRRTHTDLVRIVRQAVWAAATADAEERVTVSAPPEAKVNADGPNLRLAITNIVRNALAYSPAGSVVSVSVQVRGDIATVSITDQGLGVAAGERDAIFRPYGRGAAGKGRSGHGLGLYIARRAVEAHGGTITVASDGHGSTFSIELPGMGGTWNSRAFAS